MLQALGSIIDRIVLVCGTVLGGCLPSFVVQYRQRVGGRLDQVVADLAPFREIAARQHGGNLQALVQHHLASTDGTFHAEGEAIQRMIDAEALLRETLAALQGSVVNQAIYLAGHLDRGVATATWESFVPAFTLDAGSIGIAVTVGVLCWLLFLGIWNGIAWIAKPAPERPRRVKREPGFRS